MGLFGSDTDDGCTGHHYGEAQEYWDSLTGEQVRASFPASSNMACAKIFVPRGEPCLHSGCYETRDLGIRSYIVPIQALLMKAGDRPKVSANGEASDYAERLRELADQIDPSMEADEDGQ